jgi:hypothetical protein
MRYLVAQGEHLFQQLEFIERTRAFVHKGEHLFQQPECKEEKKKWWDVEENKLEFGASVKKRQHDARKLTSGSTEEATYWAIDGADENGRYILIPDIFGTNDLNFRKKVRRRNGKRTKMKFHAMETIDELHLRKHSTKTCTNLKAGPYMNCSFCLAYRKSGGKAHAD